MELIYHSIHDYIKYDFPERLVSSTYYVCYIHIYIPHLVFHKKYKIFQEQENKKYTKNSHTHIFCFVLFFNTYERWGTDLSFCICLYTWYWSIWCSSIVEYSYIGGWSIMWNDTGHDDCVQEWRIQQRNTIKRSEFDWCTIWLCNEYICQFGSINTWNRFCILSWFTSRIKSYLFWWNCTARWWIRYHYNHCRTE